MLRINDLKSCVEVSKKGGVAEYPRFGEIQPVGKAWLNIPDLGKFSHRAEIVLIEFIDNTEV